MPGKGEQREHWSAWVPRFEYRMLETLVGPERTEELEMTVFDKYIERGRQQGRAEGKAEGKAEALIDLLTLRGVHVDDSSRQRILSCTDLATVDQWFARALKASRLSEIFEELTQ